MASSIILNWTAHVWFMTLFVRKWTRLGNWANHKFTLDQRRNSSGGARTASKWSSNEKKKKKKKKFAFSVVSCEPVRNRAAIFDWLATVGSPRLSSLSPCYSRTSICVFWHQLHNNTLPSLVLSFSRSLVLSFSTALSICRDWIAVVLDDNVIFCALLFHSFLGRCFLKPGNPTPNSGTSFQIELSRWMIDIDFCTWPSNGRVPPENLCLFNGRVESSGISSLR